MVELRLLGPVEIWTADGPVPAAEPRRLAVLAALAVDADQVVPVPTLIDRVWGEQPPAQAVSTLRSYVTRLRRTLEQACPERVSPDAAPPDQVSENDGVCVVSRSGGYRLTAGPDRVDLLRFRALVERARDAGDPAERVELLRTARGLWRGEPLGGVGGEWAARTRAQLTGELLLATVAWADAELAVGNVETVLTPLHQLAAEHPLMEPLVEAELRALAAAGRPTEALERCRAHRQWLAETYGTDQGPRLQSLYESILAGEGAGPAEPRRTTPVAPSRPDPEPALPGDGQTGEPAGPPPARSELPDPGRRRSQLRANVRRLAPAAAAVCAVAAVATGAAWFGRQDATSGTPLASPTPSATRTDDPATITEEFSAPLDLGQWEPYEHVQDNGASHWAPDQVRVSGGELQLLTHGRDRKGRGNTSGGVCWCKKGAPVRTYGVWKIRAKLDAGTGYGVVMGLWPDDGESPWITMAKVDDGERRSMYPEMTDADLNTLTGPPVEGDFTQWHTYAVEWRPTFFTFSLDDEVIFDSRTSPEPAAVPDTPMWVYVMVNSGPLKAIPAPDQSTPSTVTTHVDWISYHP